MQQLALTSGTPAPPLAGAPSRALHPSCTHAHERPAPPLRARPQPPHRKRVVLQLGKLLFLSPQLGQDLAPAGQLQALARAAAGRRGGVGRRRSGGGTRRLRCRPAAGLLPIAEKIAWGSTVAALHCAPPPAPHCKTTPFHNSPTPTQPSCFPPNTTLPSQDALLQPHLAAVCDDDFLGGAAAARAQRLHLLHH